MATSVLKIKREGELFRLTLHGEPTYDTIVAAIAVAWPEFAAPELAAEGPDAALGALQGRAKYVDDEGDLCTLTPHTFNDFLMLHSSKGGTNGGYVLKLELQTQPTTGAAPLQPDSKKSAEDECQGCCGERRRGMGHEGGARVGPKRLLLVLKGLQQSGWLTNEMLACLAEQGLPTLVQRVARKVDKINHMARQGELQNLRKLVEALAVSALETPGLEQHAGPLQEALLEEPGPAHFGEALLGLLKSAAALSFEAKVRLVEALREQLLPVLEDLVSELGIDHGEGEWMQGPEHMSVLVGKGKGKGKGKACMAMWRFLKGTGKGCGTEAPWSHHFEQAGTEEETGSAAWPFPWPQHASPWEHQPWQQHFGKGGSWWG